MTVGKRKGKEEVKVELKKGMVKEVDEYKFLGNWINSKGNLERQIDDIERKAEGIITNIIRMTKEEDLGELSTEARLIMYEKTGVPTLINNLECWTKIEEKEMERIEKLQGKMLKRLMGLPKSTPTWGILKETGMWTLEMRIRYHRMMLYQCLRNADRERLGREIVDTQRRTGSNGWTRETEKMARKMGISK